MRLGQAQAELSRTSLIQGIRARLLELQMMNQQHAGLAFVPDRAGTGDSGALLVAGSAEERFRRSAAAAELAPCQAFTWKPQQLALSLITGCSVSPNGCRAWRAVLLRPQQSPPPLISSTTMDAYPY